MPMTIGSPPTSSLPASKVSSPSPPSPDSSLALMPEQLARTIVPANTAATTAVFERNVFLFIETPHRICHVLDSTVLEANSANCHSPSACLLRLLYGSL